MKWIPVAKKLPKRSPEDESLNYFTQCPPLLVLDSKGNVRVANYEWGCTSCGVGHFWIGNSITGELRDVVAWQFLPLPCAEYKEMQTVEGLLEERRGAKYKEKYVPVKEKDWNFRKFPGILQKDQRRVRHDRV